MKSLTQSINESLEILENEVVKLFGDNPIKKGSKEVVDVLVEGEPAFAINYIFDYFNDALGDIQDWLELTKDKNAKNCKYDFDYISETFEAQYEKEMEDTENGLVICWQKDGRMFAVPYDDGILTVK
jgi:hypothetical protein|nr:MAG TPA: hypothetical protein [Caudoviricetes sp.]